jgi:glycosyltransferase involved in cell wall biosynthesis
MKVLVVAGAFPELLGGGAKRSFEVIKHYSKYGVEPILFIPYTALYKFTLMGMYNLKFSSKDVIHEFGEIVDKLSSNGVIIPNATYQYSEEIVSQLQSNHHKRLRKLTVYELVQLKKTEFKTTRKYLEEVKSEASRIRFIYSLDGPLDSILMAYYAANRLSKPFGILLQSEPYYEDLKEMFRFINMEGWSIPRLAIKYLTAIYANTYIKHEYLNVVKDNKLRLLASVSEAPLKLSGLIRQVNNNYIRILYPANAYDDDLIKYRKVNDKCNYAVFSARLTCEKGILEIPYIWRKVLSKLPGAELIITGAFNKPKVESLFKFLIRKLNLEKNIKYLGFIKRRKLLETVSKAKLLVYPSHKDAFPLIVLESLALGTTVVAYRIPAITSVYKDVEAVFTVPEYDIKAMAEKVVDILKLEHSKLMDLHENELTLKFLKNHSSWENVAKTEVKIMKEYC